VWLVKPVFLVGWLDRHTIEAVVEKVEREEREAVPFGPLARLVKRANTSFLGGIKAGGNWPGSIQFQFDHRNGRID
jgi:hypothetical protein